MRYMGVHVCRTHTQPWGPTSRKSPHPPWLMQVERSLRSAPWWTLAADSICAGDNDTTSSSAFELSTSLCVFLAAPGGRAGGWEEFGQAGACSGRRFEQWLSASSSSSLCVFPGGGGEKLDEFLGTSCSPGK